MRRPPSLATLRAAWWAQRALLRARRQLSRHGVESIALPAPPRVSQHAVRGVLALLRRRRHSCLERALVLQRWLAAHGESRDVVIGVRSPRERFGAHAWLDGDESGEAFHELRRLPA